MSAKRHKAVTVQRGTDSEGRPGCAARCETEGCGEITFGGIPSRSAARAALAGHEDAPGAGSHQPEGNETNSEGTNPVSIVQVQEIGARVVSELEKLGLPLDSLADETKIGEVQKASDEILKQAPAGVLDAIATALLAPGAANEDFLEYRKSEHFQRLLAAYQLAAAREEKR